jgi:hypothetical protein
MTHAFAPLAGLTPATHRPDQALHGPGAAWPETNCALDLYLELLNVTGRTPRALGVIAFSADFFEDCWVTLKPGSDDLARHGLSIVEYNTTGPLLGHVGRQLDAGRLMTVEVDSWWLPDTVGTAYRTDHVKTSITPIRIDVAAQTMGYLHNAGCYDLSGEDFDSVWSEDVTRTRVPLPYLELVRLGAVPTEAQLRAACGPALAAHLAQAPADNPVARLQEFLIGSIPTISGDEPAFHRLAFATTRQLGATAQLASAFLRWWDPAPAAEPSPAALFEEISHAVGRTQFALARAARGRRVDPDNVLRGIPAAWGEAMAAVRAHARQALG